MAKRACWREIPTELSLEQFEEFILPHLTVGRRGPAAKLSLHALFNYILKLLYLGCQWKELPIEKDATGRRGPGGSRTARRNYSTCLTTMWCSQFPRRSRSSRFRTRRSSTTFCS